MQQSIGVTVLLGHCSSKETQKLRTEYEHYIQQIQKYSHYVDNVIFGDCQIDYYTIRTFMWIFSFAKLCTIRNFVGFSAEDSGRLKDINTVSSVKVLHLVEASNDEV